ncbi:hypothetical protein GVAV_002632 [Gurleya vavrai]
MPLFDNSSSLIKFEDHNNVNNLFIYENLRFKYLQPRLYNLKNYEFNSKTSNDIQKRIHHLKKLSHDKLFEILILKKNLYKTYRKLSKDPLHKLSITLKSSNTDFVKKFLYKYTNPLSKVDNQKIIEKSKLPSLKTPNKKQISLLSKNIHFFNMTSVETNFNLLLDKKNQKTNENFDNKKHFSKFSIENGTNNQSNNIKLENYNPFIKNSNFFTEKQIKYFFEISRISKILKNVKIISINILDVSLLNNQIIFGNLERFEINLLKFFEQTLNKQKGNTKSQLHITEVNETLANGEQKFEKLCTFKNNNSTAILSIDPLVNNSIYLENFIMKTFDINKFFVQINAINNKLEKKVDFFILKSKNYNFSIEETLRSIALNLQVVNAHQNVLCIKNIDVLTFNLNDRYNNINKIKSKIGNETILSINFKSKNMVEHKKSNKKTNGLNFKNSKKNINFLHDQKTLDLRRLNELKKINFLKDANIKIHNQLICEGTKVELLINNDLIINKQNKINIGSSNNQSIKHNVSKTIKILKKTSDPVVKIYVSF